MEKGRVEEESNGGQHQHEGVNVWQDRERDPETDSKSFMKRKGNGVRERVSGLCASGNSSRAVFARSKQCADINVWLLHLLHVHVHAHTIPTCTFPHFVTQTLVLFIFFFSPPFVCFFVYLRELQSKAFVFDTEDDKRQNFLYYQNISVLATCII